VRVIVPVVSPEHVCIRYRVSAYAEMLASAGYHLDYRLIPAGLWGRLRLARQCAGADAVWVQRWLPSLPVARLLRRCARRLIFDFDDAIWQRDSYHRRGPYSRRNLARFRRMVQLADLVLAGNDYLADHARRYAAAAATVHRLPTVVDPARYRVATHDRPQHRANPPGLAWLGQHAARANPVPGSARSGRPRRARHGTDGDLRCAADADALAGTLCALVLRGGAAGIADVRHRHRLAAR
jgi:hypothetical protein